MRRRATVMLHWTNLVLLTLLLAAGGTQPVLAVAFGLAGLAMVALALGFGLMNGPGPKLQGALRSLHPWLARLMYALLGWTAATVLAAGIGAALPGPAPRDLLLALFGAGLLHGCFHLWRASALNDGALRRMLP